MTKLTPLQRQTLETLAMVTEPGMPFYWLQLKHRRAGCALKNEGLCKFVAVKNQIWIRLTAKGRAALRRKK